MAAVLRERAGWTSARALLYDVALVIAARFTGQPAKSAHGPKVCPG